MQISKYFSASEEERHIELRPWRELTLLMLVGMEVSWVVPWFRSLTPATYAVAPWQGALILGGIMLVSLSVVRLLDFLRLRASVRQGVTLGLLLVSVFVGLRTLLYSHETILLEEMFTRPLRNMADVRILIPEEFVIMLTVLIGWWRGISLAQERIGPIVVREHFVVGIIMFVLFGFFNTLVTGETPGYFIFSFLLFSILGMSFARFSVLSQMRGGRSTDFNRRWFGGVVLASTVTVGLALLFADLIARFLHWIAYLIMGFFGLIALLLWLLLTPVLALLINVINRNSNSTPFFQQISEQIERFQNMMRELMERISTFVGISGLGDTISRWTPGIKLLLLGSVLALIVAGILIWMAMQIWKERKRRKLAEEQQAILEHGELWQLLKTILRNQWNSIVNAVTNATDLRKQARLRAAARIRQVYADLMELSKELGSARNEAQTPLEFLPELIRCFPTLDEQVSLITQAYLRVRYGELPETRQEVLDVEEAWKLVLNVGKERLEERKQQKPRGSGGEKPFRNPGGGSDRGKSNRSNPKTPG
jgi:hypothetical protein